MDMRKFSAAGVISIHALRVEGDLLPRVRHLCERRISIHALRVEGDTSKPIYLSRESRFLSTPSGWRATLGALATLEAPMDFYPRPPGGGRRLKYCRKVLDGTVFLSTPSGWRATGFIHRRLRRHRDFYPRPPGGGRPEALNPTSFPSIYFYPRPPGGGRQLTRLLEGKQRIFLSTPSGWRATGRGERRGTGDVISIHALRVEGDSKNGQSFRLFLRKREKKLPL